MLLMGVFKNVRMDKNGDIQHNQFCAICAHCQQTIGWLEPEETLGLSREPDGPLSPGLICFDCYERQCDGCGMVLSNQKSVFSKGSYQFCKTCLLGIETKVKQSGGKASLSDLVARNVPKRDEYALIYAEVIGLTNPTGCDGCNGKCKGLSNAPKVRNLEVKLPSKEVPF